jgi:small GTP-binding protein
MERLENRQEDTMEDEEIAAKVIVVGGASAGKSSLIKRFAERTFAPTKPTTGIDFCARTVEVRGVKFRLQIWDTAGQERTFSSPKSYYRECAAALIVYDVTDRASFAQLQTWINTVREYSENPEIWITVIGTKRDAAERRAVSREEAEAFARERNLSFVEASAKTDENVELAFFNVAAAVARKLDQGSLSLDDPKSGLKVSSKKAPTTKLRQPDASSLVEGARASEGWCCT